MMKCGKKAYADKANLCLQEQILDKVWAKYNQIVQVEETFLATIEQILRITANKYVDIYGAERQSHDNKDVNLKICFMNDK